MTREELNLKLHLHNDVHPGEQHSSSLELRNYIELRLIADALIDISKSLKSKDYKGDTYNITEAITDLHNKS